MATDLHPRCSRCNQPGPHFVPPSFGQTGFYLCDPNDKPRQSRTPENYVMLCRACTKPIYPGNAWMDRAEGGYVHKGCALDGD